MTWQTLSLAFRAQRRRWRATSWVVATLAIGISANAAIFAFLHGSYLKPLPYKDPDRLFTVTRPVPQWGIEAPLSPPIYREVKASGIFQQTGGFISSVGAVRFNEERESIGMFRADASLFEMLQPPCTIGRAFGENEDDAVILSHEFWRSRFAGRLDILDDLLELDDEPRRIVGVLSPTVALPTPQHAHVWIPMKLTPQDARNRGLNIVSMIGRLHSGMTASNAADRLKAIEEPSGGPKQGWTVESLHIAVTGDTYRQLFLLQAAATLLLIVVCLNVSFLLFSAAVDRRAEMATRVALGASRWEISKQLFAEASVLVIPATALGILGADFLRRLLIVLAPNSLERVSEVGWSWQVVAQTILISTFCVMVCSLAPLVRQLRLGVTHPQGRHGTTTVRHWPVRLLVAGESASALVLMVLAGLMISSLSHINSQDLGLNPKHLLAVGTELPRHLAQIPEVSYAFYSRVLERLKVLPGVESATVSSLANFHQRYGGVMFEIEEEASPRVIKAVDASVFPGYFATLKSRLVEGRPFSESDVRTSAAVAVVTQTLAKRLGKKVGDQIEHQGQLREIVGIASDIKVGRPDEDFSYAVFVPASQHPWQVGPFLLVRTTSDSVDVPSAVRRLLVQEEPDVIINLVAYSDVLTAHTLSERRFQTGLLSGYAALAMLLLALGLYGTISYSLVARRREIAVRIALGARPSDVVRRFMGGSLWPVVAGVALGIPAAITLARQLALPLFNVAVTDTPTWFSASSILVLASVAASLGPIRRALCTHPASVLRQE